jgi:hypothetical protein
LADLADEQGLEIPAGWLTGEWRAESNYEWPHQPCPPKRAWATLRQTLRETLCFETSPWQRANREMKLSQPLGTWLDVPRNVKYQCYRNKNCLFWREEGTIQMLKQQGRTGFYKYAGEVDSIPPRTHPQSCAVWTDQSLWTQRKYSLQKLPPDQVLPPGQVISNSIGNTQSQVLKVGSDGSVYINKKPRQQHGS